MRTRQDIERFVIARPNEVRPKQSPTEIEIASSASPPRNDELADHISKYRLPSDMHKLIWTRVISLVT